MYNKSSFCKPINIDINAHIMIEKGFNYNMLFLLRERQQTRKQKDKEYIFFHQDQNVLITEILQREKIFFGKTKKRHIFAPVKTNTLNLV